MTVVSTILMLDYADLLCAITSGFWQVTFLSLPEFLCLYLVGFWWDFASLPAMSKKSQVVKICTGTAVSFQIPELQVFSYKMNTYVGTFSTIPNFWLWSFSGLANPADAQKAWKSAIKMCSCWCTMYYHLKWLGTNLSWNWGRIESQSLFIKNSWSVRWMLDQMPGGPPQQTPRRNEHEGGGTKSGVTLGNGGKMVVSFGASTEWNPGWWWW